VHSTVKVLDGTDDAMLSAADWPCELAAFFPKPRPGRVVIRWSGQLKEHNLFRFFERVAVEARLDTHRDHSRASARAVVLADPALSRIKGSSIADLERVVGDVKGADFLRLELSDHDAFNVEPSIVVWANRDGDHREDDGVIQQALGVELSITDSSRVGNAVVIALLETKPSNPKVAISRSLAVRSVNQLLEDITDFSGGNSGHVAL